MTSERVDVRDEDFLVHVKAQVMSRDDNKGGWVPRGAGGMSIISLCRLPPRSSNPADVTSRELLIYGRRIADKSVVLSCALHKDLQYTRANPTFHHWRTEGKRFGLTFQSSTEARHFEKAIRRAVESMREAKTDKTVGERRFNRPTLSLDRKDSISRPESTASTTVSTPSLQSPSSPTMSSLPCFPGVDSADGRGSRASSDDTASASRSARTLIGQSTGDAAVQSSDGLLDTAASTTALPAAVDPPWYRTFPPFTAARSSRASDANCRSLPAMAILTPLAPVASSSKSKKDDGGAGRRRCGDVATALGTSSTDSPPTLAEVGAASREALSRSAADQYVQFAKSSDDGGDACFDYSYPQLNAVTGDTAPYPVPSHPPLPVVATPPRPAFLRPAPNVTDQPSQRLLSRTAHCVYCQQMYDVTNNAVGSCRHAPDPLSSAVDVLTCGTCARLTLGRCCRVVDPEEEAHPCSGELDATCGRWAALTALSVVVPCLCCYWPLTACGQGAARCGWYSGRRHRPI